MPRAGARDAPAGPGAAPLVRRRPGARAVAPRRAGAAGAAPATSVAPAQAFIAMHWGAEYVAGLGRATRLTARRPSARSRSSPSSSTRRCAWSAPSCPGRSWPPPGCPRPTRWRCASGCASCSPASPTRCACRSAARGRSDLRATPRQLASACCSVPPRPSRRRRRAGRDRRRAATRQRRGAALCRRARRAAPRDAPARRRQLAGLHAGRRRLGAGLGARPAATGAARRRLRARAAGGQPAATAAGGATRARRSAPATTSAKHAIVGCWRNARATSAQRLQQLQARLRCGTECGSCLPALKALVQRHRQARLPRHERSRPSSPSSAPAPATRSCSP